MMRHYGAGHDLENLIKTHLFVISPNNSGSTFLKNVLATSRHTWNLEREGQHTFGFAGPSTRQSGTHLIWASQKSWIDLFTDAQAYNWPLTRKAWYFQAFSHNPEATVFVTKSPPCLLNVAQLHRAFAGAKFIFMVRNPYAAVEGICRRRKRHTLPKGHDIREAAARHIINCLRYQKQNIETYGDCGLFFSYEAMCDQPDQVEQSLQELVPELDDLTLCQRISVKGIYNETLRNMNDQQISRLTAADLRHINQVFEQQQDLLDYFRYPLQAFPTEQAPDPWRGVTES